MQKKYRDIIKQHFPKLVDTIEPEMLANHLLGRKVFTKKDIKEIFFEKEDYKHNNRLLIFRILKKNNNAYHEFKNGLEIFQWGHLLASNNHRTHITAFNPGNQNRQDEEPIISNFHNFTDRINDTASSIILPGNDLKPLDVRVRLATEFQHSDADDIYNTKSSNRGQVLIINNKIFNKHLKREGSEQDVKCLESLFKQMFFKVTVYTDLSVREMEKAIQDFAAYSSDKISDICIVIIMSHGSEREGHLVILDKYNESLRTSCIEEQFNNSNCILFSGKPKIFFYQICRGNQLDYAITNSRSTTSHLNLVSSHNDSGDSVQTDSGRMLLPVERRLGDMLVGYATQKGYKAHRDSALGSWYIQLICQVFMEKAHNTDILKMLNEVDSKLEKRATPEFTMQTSSYTSNGFNKLLYFHPGIYLDDSGNIQKFV